MDHEQAALKKLKSLLGTPEGEWTVDLFVRHHLEELESSYFEKALGTPTPAPSQILDTLVLVESWSSENNSNIDVFDFSLQGDVTDYVLSVQFSGEEIIEVSMDS